MIKKVILTPRTKIHTFETLQTRKSKWTLREGQFASVDYFSNKCRHDINNLGFNRNTKFFNLSSEERVALEDRRRCFGCLAGQPLPKRIFAATYWHFFYAKVDKDLSSSNQKFVNRTINDLKAVNQELPVTASNVIITTFRTSCINFLPHICKPNKPGWPTVFVCRCPTKLVSRYLNMQNYAIYRQIFTVIWEPKRSIKITDHFTCSSANVIYCITCIFCTMLHIG